MKRFLPTLCLWVLLASCFVAVSADRAAAQPKLRHVVAFKFKEDASKEKITALEKAFRDLKKKIPQVSSYEWGTNISKEQRDKGFTHCFILTFKNEADRDLYSNHEEHKAFVKMAQEILADVFVIDFWAQK